MIKKIFKNLSKSFCIYLLTVLNLIYAIQHQSFDWLLWASVTLAALSLVLNIISATKDGVQNA